VHILPQLRGDRMRLNQLHWALGMAAAVQVPEARMRPLLPPPHLPPPPLQQRPQLRLGRCAASCGCILWMAPQVLLARPIHAAHCLTSIQLSPRATSTHLLYPMPALGMFANLPEHTGGAGCQPRKEVGNQPGEGW
jgi:hypothetical protein